MTGIDFFMIYIIMSHISATFVAKMATLLALSENRGIRPYLAGSILARKIYFVVRNFLSHTRYLVGRVVIKGQKNVGSTPIRHIYLTSKYQKI